MRYHLEDNNLIPNHTRSRIWLTGLGIAILFYLLLGLAFRSPSTPSALQPNTEPNPSHSHTIDLGNLHLILYSNHTLELTWHQTFFPPANPEPGEAWLRSQQGHLDLN